MDSQFLKFFVLICAYNKYSERHCGIYFYVRNVRILDQPFSLEPLWNPPSRNPGYAPGRGGKGRKYDDTSKAELPH